MSVTSKTWGLATAAVALTIGLASAALADDAPVDQSLKGKTIGITAIGTDHYWDLKAYQGAIDEVKRLGGTPVALDAGRKDTQQVARIYPRGRVRRPAPSLVGRGATRACAA